MKMYRLTQLHCLKDMNRNGLVGYGTSSGRQLGQVVLKGLFLCVCLHDYYTHNSDLIAISTNYPVI